MPHQTQLEKKKYRNWVQAGLGLKYVKEGLQSFCVDIVERQHDDIINNVKQSKNLSTVTCGQCSLRDLEPDHVKVGNKQCPLGQVYCNCWYAGKTPCPNNVCGAIYDQIIKAHGSTPPAPYWKNTDIQKWSTDPWSIAKCFINALGYDRKSSAVETDCTGLLHLIINNTEFHNHIQCQITGTDVFSMVRDYRNKIFHSDTMELENDDVEVYIDNMIAILQDDLELKNRADSQMAVNKLKELKKEDFVITTQNEAEICRTAMRAIKEKELELEQMIKDAKEDIKLKRAEALDELDLKKMDISGKLSHEGSQAKDEIKQTTDKFEKKTKEALEAAATKDDIACLDSRLSSLEQNVERLKQDLMQLQKELECLQKARSAQKEQSDYVESKLDFQKRLISHYKENVLNVPAMPLQPESNQSGFTEVYVQPKMSVKRKVNEKPAHSSADNNITSMSEIFTKDGKRLDSVYVVGESGTGKTFFSKSLVHFWCMAHTDNRDIEDKFDGIKEMRKFEFLFHISLRHYSNTTTVKDMLDEEYGHPTLTQILEKESANCLIVLDGLDEWNPQNKMPPHVQAIGAPKRDLFKDYTVITTTRPWKIETLRLQDSDIKQRIELVGLAREAEKDMIEKTLSILNESFGENKSADDCAYELDESPVSDIMHIPIVLQQLVCLWFDGRLSGTSRCAIYSDMLDLFFAWSSKRIPDDLDLEAMRNSSNVLGNIELPQHLIHSEFCKRYKFLIYNISSLAFETLVNESKEMSLTFDRSTLEKLGITDEVKRCCLKLGVLNENRSTSLSASRPAKSLFSFVHKSLQEFLAAVYVAVNFNSFVRELLKTKGAIMPENFKHFTQNYFGKCRTVEDILEKANVFALLCGLQPHSVTYISEYVYNIVMVECSVVEYRTKITSVYMYTLSAIQQCIYRCLDEVLANEINFHPRFFLGDVVVDNAESCHNFREVLRGEYIIVDRVMSFYCAGDSSLHDSSYCLSEHDNVFEHLPKCQRLTTMKLREFGSDSGINVSSISETLKLNVSTLQSISFNCIQAYDEDWPKAEHFYSVLETFLSNMSAMDHLVALKISNYPLTAEQSNALCISLSKTTRLKQISLESDYYWDTFALDLSDHQQLQYLEICRFADIQFTNTANLEVFAFRNLSNRNTNAVFNIINMGSKLTTLELACDNLSERTQCYPFFNKTVTNKLITLLPSLPQLQELTLRDFTFTDNIIMYPYEMKQLQKLELSLVSMSMLTWCKMIDSFSLLPNEVAIELQPFCITEKECQYFIIRYAMSDTHDLTAAFQYIKERLNMFFVSDTSEFGGSEFGISFTTNCFIN